MTTKPPAIEGLDESLKKAKQWMKFAPEDGRYVAPYADLKPIVIAAERYAQGQTAVPEGMALVPLEPTADMVFFAFDVSSINRPQCSAVYKAMIAAHLKG